MGHEDYHINIHSILTSNIFLDISIHIQSCGSDFWKYLLLFSPSNRPKLTGLFTFPESTLIYVNLNFIHPCNGFACNIECFVCCALPTTAGSSLGPSPGSRVSGIWSQTTTSWSCTP